MSAIKHNLKLEDEEEAEDESGYTIIGGDEVEVLPEEVRGRR